MPIKFAPSMMDALNEKARETGNTIAELVRRAVAKELSPASAMTFGAVGVDDSLVSRHKFLTTAPGGPFEEAVEQSGEFLLSTQVAAELGALPTDVFVRVSGESMEPRIPNGALLLMRRLVNARPPRRDTPTLVQVVSSSGEYSSTIKYYLGDGKLVDGAGETVLVPKGTREMLPVAEAVGLIALL